MESNALQHPRIGATVERLVAAGGGRVTYESGCFGREMLVGAGVRLATLTDLPLRVVEAPERHPQVADFIREVAPDTIRCSIMSAQEMVLQPVRQPRPIGIMAVHADVLSDPAIREPLRALAQSAQHLVVARHLDSDTTLDALVTPEFVLMASDLKQRTEPFLKESLGEVVDRMQQATDELRERLARDYQSGVPRRRPAADDAAQTQSLNHHQQHHQGRGWA